MRYVPAYCIRPGQKIAVDLVADRQRIMLRKGVVLTPPLVHKIRYLGFQGVYIDDDISKDIEIANVISDELKYKAKREVRAFLANVANRSPKRVSQQIVTITKVIKNIVDEVMRNRNLMVSIVDLRSYDDYTFSHSVNVAILSVVIGASMGMGRDMLDNLALGALIHDIGKVFIDQKIVNKPTLLTGEELEEVRKHSLLGYNYLYSNTSMPEEVKAIALSHHERCDGSGYPNGLTGKDLNIFTKIVCVADVYDALTSDRPYRTAMLPSDAYEYIMSGYDSLFDPAVVTAFTKRVAPYPVGVCVRLSTGQSAIVVKNYEAFCLRPKVRIIENGKPTGEYIDLAYDRDALNITITEIIKE